MIIISLIIFCALIRLGVEITKSNPNWELCIWILTSIFLSLIEIKLLTK